MIFLYEIGFEHGMRVGSLISRRIVEVVLDAETLDYEPSFRHGDAESFRRSVRHLRVEHLFGWILDANEILAGDR